MVDGNKLNSVLEFTYLGSTISSNGCIDDETQRRMAKASASFGRLYIYTLERTGLPSSTYLLHKYIYIYIYIYLCSRYVLDGSPVRSSVSLFVTLSIQVILMIEPRCRIMKACNFFTCRLYLAQASAP